MLKYLNTAKDHRLTFRGGLQHLGDVDVVAWLSIHSDFEWAMGSTDYKYYFGNVGYLIGDLVAW